MKQQPDQLFRDKLSQFSKTAPESAWSRIEGSAQARPFPYYKIAAAAALVILGIAWYALKPANVASDNLASDAVNSSTTTEVPEAKNTNPIAEPEASQMITSTTTKKDTATSITKVPQGPNLKRETTTALAEIESEPAVIIPSEINTGAEPGEIEIIEESTAFAEVTPAEDVSELLTDRNNVVIVLTAAETEEYLIKNSDPDATSGKKPTSTLKKVWSRAKDLKSNQSPFGDLRQMKDELLALNFKSDKQRGQKK